MELIKRKILLEDLYSRNSDFTYGAITADTISLNIFLTQTVENGGIFSDSEYVNEPLYDLYSSGATPNLNNILVYKLTTNGFSFPFMSGSTDTFTDTGFTSNLRLVNANQSDYYVDGLKVTGVCESKIGDYRGYLAINKYPVNHDFEKEVFYDYRDYSATTMTGVSRITNYNYSASTTLTSSTYVKMARLDSNIGTINQKYGILYVDYNSVTSFVNKSLFETIVGSKRYDFNDAYTPFIDSSISNTTYQFSGQGWNQLNTSLSALVKEEKYLKIISPPEIQNDVYIDRGNMNVIEPHLRLAEIESVDHMGIYNNGYYRISYNSL